MKFLCLFLFMFSGTPAFSQGNIIPAGNLWPVGGCPPPPRGELVSFLLTTHSSDGREIKVYNEVRIRGNSIPDSWRILIGKLPHGSVVYFSEIIMIRDGEKILLPAVKYIMW